MRWWCSLAAVLAIGCQEPPRHPAGECARVWWYAVDPEIDRVAVRRALDDWAAATDGRECFEWRRERPDIRFTVAHSAVELAAWSPKARYADDAGATAGLWVAREHAIVLVAEHYKPEQLRALLVHELGHVLLGSWHADGGVSALRPDLADDPAAGPIPAGDVAKYCELNRCD